MGSTKTELYNVYIVSFRTPGGRHEGIALVPAQQELQNEGRFYHVIGDVRIGMEYELRNPYNFGITKTFKAKVYQFQLPISYLPDFERIVKSHNPRYDPHALTESDPYPPVTDCAAWVAEVLEEVRAFLKSAGLAA